MAAQGDGRKLQAEGSNPDAPEKKSARTDGSVEVDMEEVMPAWAKFMMDRIVGKVENVEVQVAAAEKAANEAKDEAMEAKVAVTTLESEMEKVKKEMTELKGDGLEKAIEKVVEAKWPVIGEGRSGPEKGYGGPAGVGKGSGKAGGKEAKREDEKSRTIVFGNFPEETQEDDIIKFIEGKVESVRADIEEVFTFAKAGARGAAKFFSQDAMWKYMVDQKGHHYHEHQGGTIYVNAPTDSSKDPDDAAREKAVRKVVRVLIEHNNGNGAEIKKRIEAKYKAGIVRWKADDNKWKKVAEWKPEEGKMELMAEAAALQAPFDVLMG